MAFVLGRGLQSAERVCFEAGGRAVDGAGVRLGIRRPLRDRRTKRDDGRITSEDRQSGVSQSIVSCRQQRQPTQ